MTVDECQRAIAVLSTGIRDSLHALKNAAPTEKASLCAEYYRALRDIHDELDEVKKTAYKQMEDYAMNTMPKVFDAESVSTITLASGYRVTINELLRASIPAENKEKAYKWLIDNDLGDLISQTVNASTLSATARTMIKEGRELPDGIFKTAILPQVSLTRVK